MLKARYFFKGQYKALKIATIGAVTAAFSSIMVQSAMGANFLPPEMITASGTTLMIAATGEVKATPDLATITAMTSAEGTTAANATADNAKKMTDLLANIRNAGISNDNIETRNINISPRYRYEQNKTPQRIGYQAQSSIQIRIHDLSRVGSILDKMVQANVEDLEGPNFSLSNSAKAEDEARLQAITTARSRADLYARSVGLRVKRIMMISEGQLVRPMPLRPMLMAAKSRTANSTPETPVISGQQTVTITVNVAFELG